MTQQKTHRRQLQEIASKIGKEAHNINAYKRRKSLQYKNGEGSTHKLLQHTLPTQFYKEDEKASSHYTVGNSHSADKGRMVPDKYTKRIIPNKRKKSHVTDYTQSNYTQNFFTRRNTNNTNQLKNTIHKLQVKNIASDVKLLYADDQINQTTKTDQIAFTQKQRSVFKNKALNDSHFQNWINQVLIQRCPQEKFDSNIVNAAIKRYQIDKNTLISHGVSQANISRVLKSLFVYSIGFNSLISEIGRSNIQLKTNLWKVFSILIEYCSQGMVHTVVSHLQNENQIQQQALIKEIERQKEVIEHNNQLNIQKNEKIYKENNELKLKNQQLELDRAVLIQSSEQHERAFAEEVSLRMMFQSKISDLHRLYRQLELKHHKLFSDFQQKMNELAYYKQKSDYYQNDNLNLKKSKAGLQGEVFQRGHQIRKLNETIIKFKHEINDHYSSNVQRRLENRVNQSIIKQKEIKEAQMTNKLKTVEMSLNEREKAHQSLRSQYFRSLQENQRLIVKLNGELAQIARRLIEQKEMFANSAHFLSEINILSLKVQEKSRILENMEALIKENLDRIEQLSAQIQQKDVCIASLQSNLTANGETISNLKRVNNDWQQSYTNLQKINENLERKAKDLIRNMQKQSDAAVQWREKYEKIYQQLQKSRAKVNLLLEQSKKIENTFKNRKEEVEYTLTNQKQKSAKIQSELNQKRIEVERVRQALQGMEVKYKSQKFERDNLEYKYKHSLTVFENTQTIIKNQNSTISELERNVQEITLELKLTKNQHGRLESKYVVESQKNNKRIQELYHKLQLKHAYIHPMIFEDLLEHHRRLQEQNDDLKKALDIWKEEHHEKRMTMQEKIILLQDNFRRKQNEFTEQIIRKELQIEYEKLKIKEYTQRIDNLELIIRGKQMVQMKQDLSQSYKKKQKRYLQIISENNFKIDSLVNDLQAVQNHNQQLIGRIQFTEKQLDKRQQIIVSMQKQKQELVEVNNALSDQKVKFEVTKKQLIQQINEKESLINTIIPEYKSLRQSPQKYKKSRQKSPVAQRKENVVGMKRKGSMMQSLMQPVIVQIKEREQERSQYKRPSQKSSYQNEDWRADFTNKLKSSFGYYH